MHHIEESDLELQSGKSLNKALRHFFRTKRDKYDQGKISKKWYLNIRAAAQWLNDSRVNFGTYRKDEFSFPEKTTAKDK
jgi:hypothetical protein